MTTSSGIIEHISIKLRPVRGHLHVSLKPAEATDLSLHRPADLADGQPLTMPRPPDDPRNRDKSQPRLLPLGKLFPGERPQY